MEARRQAWYRNPFGRWMIIAPILITLVSAAFGAWVLHRQSYCDRVANADLAKLAAAWQRFANELEGLECDAELAVPTEQRFKYLHGPYYGWGGTHYRCFTLIRLEDSTVCSCSMNGRVRDGQKKKRTIYRIDLITGKDLPSIVGRCGGREYARRGDQLYTSSMIKKEGGECRIVEPSPYSP